MLFHIELNQQRTETDHKMLLLFLQEEQKTDFFCNLITIKIPEQM